MAGVAPLKRAVRGGAVTVLAEWLLVLSVLAFFGAWFLWSAGVR